MRFPHWLKTVASTMLLSAIAGSATAQDYGAAGVGQFQPAFGTNNPGAMYPQGLPQGYQPYPAVSPYGMGNVAWDQTFQDSNGLWVRRILNANREYYGSFDISYNEIKRPGNRHLGSEYLRLDDTSNGLLGWVIPTYGQGGVPGTGTGGAAQGAGSTLPDSRVYFDDAAFPYPFLVPDNGVGDALVDNSLFPIRDLTAFGDFRTMGLKGAWGFFNEDGSGFGVNAFWTGLDKQLFQMGQDSIDGVPITQEMITSVDGSILFTRNGAIPLDWGFYALGNFGGNLGANKYDLLFSYYVKTYSIGSDANYYMPPTVEREAFKLRPFIGGRYLHINEQFNFRGIDSGFGYELEDSQVGGGGGGGQNQQSATYRPDAGTIQANYDMFEATLTNNVRSNLAGGQVGLRYDFGDGDEFHLWGQSTVGLLANREEFRQYGNNIGDQQGLLLFSNGIDMLAENARFSSDRTLTHVSPMFEQTIMAEMEILDQIPIVKNLPFIENTVFRVGYTYTLVGEVARAGESIDWRGYPLIPSIRPGREAWWMTQWNLGVEKRF